MELKNGIHEAAKAVLGERKTPQRNQWFDEECAEIIKKKNNVRLKTLNSNTRSCREEYKKTRKEAKNSFGKKERNTYRQKLK